MDRKSLKRFSLHTYSHGAISSNLHSLRCNKPLDITGPHSHQNQNSFSVLPGENKTLVYRSFILITAINSSATRFPPEAIAELFGICGLHPYFISLPCRLSVKSALLPSPSFPVRLGYERLLVVDIRNMYKVIYLKSWFLHYPSAIWDVLNILSLWRILSFRLHCRSGWVRWFSISSGLS